jgi:hypothetical protein
MHAPATPDAEMTLRTPLSHRGFSLTIRRAAGMDGDGVFAYTVVHQGLPLHRSRADYRSATAADRAARRFIDDALGAFEAATSRIAA